MEPSKESEQVFGMIGAMDMRHRLAIAITILQTDSEIMSRNRPDLAVYLAAHIPKPDTQHIDRSIAFLCYLRDGGFIKSGPAEIEA